MRNCRKYTYEEREFLKDYTPGHSYKEIKEAFNSRFPEITLSQIIGFIKNNGLNTGRTGRFEKGHISPNKGKKMPKDVYEKCKGTMFKQGHIAKNKKSIGAEEIRSDGYIWVKVSDKPKEKASENWRQKQRLVWERANGPIPDGYVIIFRDNNRLNCELSNLSLISSSEHMIMNNMGIRLGQETIDTSIGIAKVMNLIKKKGSKK